MKNQCMQDEGVDHSLGCMRAFVWDFKGSQSFQWRTPPGSLQTPSLKRYIWNSKKSLATLWTIFCQCLGQSPASNPLHELNICFTNPLKKPLILA